MTVDVEIMLRTDDRVFQERVALPAAAQALDVDAIRALLHDILRAVRRLVEPSASPDQPVTLRGVSWIAHQAPAGVVLALETHSAAIVAGPLPLTLDALESLVARACVADAPRSVLH